MSYQINQSIIFREEDLMLFSAEKMQLYKFNNSGYDVIQAIHDGYLLNQSDIYQKVFIKNGMDEKEFNLLFNKLIENDIVQVSY